MEQHRARRSQDIKLPTLVLPLSLGVSSCVLLHMLNRDLERILANTYAKVPYNLHVLVVEPSTIQPANAPYDTNYEELQKAFSKHTFTRLPFHSIFDYVPEMADIMVEYAGSQFIDDSTQSNEDRLAAFRTCVSSATSKTDLDSVLLTRLVVGFAKQTGFETILWGDSDTRLAAKTLAGAAKGRGASLTWQVSDGPSPWGLRFEFPLRDLSKTELLQYQRVCPELSEIVIPDKPLSDNVLTKNLSIDELMMRYVQTQGEKYRGVMANVAKTANKLESSVSNDSPSCALCGGLVGNIKGNVGVSVASQSGDCHNPRFCYGCLRSRPEVISN